MVRSLTGFRARSKRVESEERRTIRRRFSGVGWLRRTKNERTDGYPLYLDGSASWRTYTGPDDVRQLGRLPVDSEIVVEAVPEPNNRYDQTAVALLYQGSRVGYLYRSLSRSLFGRSLLLVEPPAARTWKRVFRACVDKNRLSGLPSGLSESAARERRFAYRPVHISTGSRATNPYGYRPPPHTTPKHPDIGTFADVHAAGLHIGELRTRHSDAVHQILSGRDDGLAR
jgi:hypothetical protein